MLNKAAKYWPFVGILTITVVLVSFVAALFGAKPGEAAQALGSVVGGAFAVGAALLAWQAVQKQVAAQNAIAEDQLKMSLFDKRFAIFRATRELIKTVVNDSANTGFSAWSLLPSYNSISEARFYFSPSICEHIEKIRDKCHRIVSANVYRSNTNSSDPKWQTEGDVALNLTYELLNLNAELPSYFQKALEFKQLTRPES
jgi:hypothetical protein